MTKLLIIEDDALLDQAYKKKFENEYEVRIATDGESGLKMASSFLPEVILLDIYMPGKYDGLDVLRKLKENEKTARIPVIVITNLPESSEKVVAMGAVKSFMKADVDLSSIEEEVREVVAKRD